NVVSLFADRFGSALGALEDVQACTSDGTPPNITAPVGAGSTLTDHEGAALAYSDLVALYTALDQPYRSSSVWFTDRVGVAVLSKIITTEGFPLFSQQAGVPAIITDDSADGIMFRKLVYEVPLVASTGTGVLWHAAPETYAWGRRAGISVRANEAAGWATDSVAYRFTARFDGAMLDAAGWVGIENFI
ncbi:unnamed protein product, partial [marine sediment metagenome]